MLIRCAIGLFASSMTVFLIGCSGEGSGGSFMGAGRDGGAQRTVQDPDPAQRTLNTPIPSDVTYTVFDSHTTPRIKRSLDVRLSKKVTAIVLHSIALELKERDAKRYERTFICYYLPGMEVGAGAWATTHFNPELDVRILGMELEKEQALAKAKRPASQEVLGFWIDDRPYVGSKIVLYEESGKLYLDTKYKDGSGAAVEVLRAKSSGGYRLDEKAGSSFGEYYLIDPKGNLQSHDKDGLISTANAAK